MGQSAVCGAGYEFSLREADHYRRPPFHEYDVCTIAAARQAGSAASNH